jgi:S1-C subfamily serine protease
VEEDQLPPGDSPAAPPDPEQDPDAALEALATDHVPAGVTRRRLARAALAGLRQARRTARWGMGLAALALALAVALAIVTLTRDGEGESDSGTGGGANDAAAIAAAGRPATVLVRASGRIGTSFGSGVVIDAAEGLVLTNFHVIGSGGDIEAGRPAALGRASVRAAAPCDDLALLEVDGLEGAESLPLGSQKEIAQGDQVVALGYPASAAGGSSLTTTAGVVSAVHTSLRLPAPDSPRFLNLVQTDAALNPGNSGGPLVGRDGTLVGINTILFQGTGATPVNDQGYAVGVDRIRAVLGELRKSHSIGWFGAGLLVPPPQLLRRRRLPDGLLVTAAAAGTSAESAGVEEVLVIAVGDRPVGGTLAGYCKAVEGVHSGDTRVLTVITGPRRRPKQVQVEFE